MLSSRIVLSTAVFYITFAANTHAYAGGFVNDTLHAVGKGVEDTGKAIGGGVKELGKVVQPQPSRAQVPPTQPVGCTGQQNCLQPEK